MPPQVGRMPGHHSNPSNPYAHLNPTNTLQHFPQHLQSIPQAPNVGGGFGSAQFNSGISPFAPSAGGYGLQGAYGGAGLGGGQGLASEEAYRGFARGAAMQQQQQAHQAADAQMGMKSGMAARIREVWANNLEQEMAVLRQLIQKYPYVSMVCC